MKFSEVAKILNGELLNFKEDFEVSEFSIDSRKVKADSVFVPLKGNRDGHQFIEDALKNGAKAYLSENRLNFPNGVIVQDSYKALIEIGIYKRRQTDIIIGITGSSGKTSTKELLNFVLKYHFKTYATSGNLNNEIGVPLTLANIPKDTEIAIVEKGAAKKDDIKYLMEITKPDIGVLTSLAKAHIERFGSFENIVITKGQIFDGVKYGVLPSDLIHHYEDKEVDFITYGKEGLIKISELKIVEDGTEGVICYKSDRIKLKIPIYNIGTFVNIGAVAGVLYTLGLDPIRNLEVLRDFKGFEGRGDIKHIGRYLIIDESYNANPLSVKNSIYSFEKIGGIKVYILGDMLELGEHSKDLHVEVAKTFEESKIDYILLYGNEVKHIYNYLKDKKNVVLFEDKRDMVKFIKNIEGPQIKILVKGSRGMKMEEVIEYLKQFQED
ncbi:MAG: UDP-N-acetylmuramoyl-tripeptide--D-alanyl-D-alanine ligase [Hydrogenothermaceae bacterium]